MAKAKKIKPQGMRTPARLPAKPRPEHHYVPQYFGHRYKKLRTGLDDEEFMSLASEVREQGRTYLYLNRLYTLYQAVRDVARRFPGTELRFLEVGVFRGGSAYFLARSADRFASTRTMLTAVDTFEGHAAEDLPEQEGPHVVGKFDETSFDDVRAYLSPFPSVEVVKGRIQEVGAGLADEYHLIHLDVDIYGPTKAGLEIVAERLAPGGIAVVDDYGFTTCPGVRRAVDELVEDAGERFAFVALDTGQALMVRTA